MTLKNDVTVLVVDDEEMLRSLLERILTKEGYRVETAVDGSEALDKLRSNRHNLVVTDIKMPKLNGLELLKEIKSEFPETSVIVMTAYGDSFTVKDAMLMGADEYITKPFKSFEIALIVERVFWRKIAMSKPQNQPE
jgi:DNA-binding NtrC family response regulator